MKNLFNIANSVKAVLSLLIVLTVFAAAQAQTITSQSLKLMAERQKLNAKRDVAYDMGVNVGFAVYQAEVTQTEFPNKTSKIYGPALNLRTQAFAKARADAETLNAIMSNQSDKLDIQQFYQYSDGFSHEKDALTVAIAINSNLNAKLIKINGNLAEAYILGFYTAAAEANASGGESRRGKVSLFLQLSNEKAQKIYVYNQAGGTLKKLADGKTPVSEIYPKIVSLRQYYADAVGKTKVV